MGTCSELREHTTKASSYAMSGSKYGFSEKIIDGVTVKVNALIINFKSPAFEASLQVKHLDIISDPILTFLSSREYC